MTETTSPHKRWYTSLFFKCLLGILIISCTGTFLLLFSLGLHEKMRLKDELASETFRASIMAGLDKGGKRFVPENAASPQCQAMLQSLISELLPEDGAVLKRVNRSYVFQKDMIAMMRIALPDGSSCQVPEIPSKPALFQGMIECERQAKAGAHGAVWQALDDDILISAITVEPPSSPGSLLTVGVQLNTSLTHLVFPEFGMFSRTLLYLFGISFLSSILIAVFVVRRIRRAERAAVAWTLGDLSVRINDRHRDEFGHLTHSFDQMADALEKLIEMRQSLAAAEERNRLARDLHDTVKQRCFALGLQLSVLARKGLPDAEATSQLGAALELTARMQKDLSDVINRFSSPTIALSGLRQAVTDMIELFLYDDHIQWQLLLSREDEVLLQAAPDLAAQLLLITNEAVANVLRHARARNLEISFSRENGRGNWQITDDGDGFDVSQAFGKGIGLSNLMHRARSLSEGDIIIESATGAGTRLAVSFSLAVTELTL